MPEEALVEIKDTLVPVATASERKGLAEIVVSKWYYILIAVLVLMALGGLAERIFSLFTSLIPGYGAIWQKATTPTTTNVTTTP